MNLSFVDGPKTYCTKVISVFFVSLSFLNAKEFTIVFGSVDSVKRTKSGTPETIASFHSR